MALVTALLVTGAGCATVSGSGGSTRPVSSEPTVTESTITKTGLTTTEPVVWAIGDSLMVGAADRLTDAWPMILIDAQEGRSFESGIGVLEHRLETGSPDVLVFALGTNNGATSEQVARVMRLTSDIDEVVFVNIAVPRPWESATNAVFLDAASAYASATMVDWNAGSKTAAGLFRSDGYHLTANGIDAWVEMIMTEVTD